nr:MarR family transcriptional regulator [Eubacterium sp.]
MAQEYDQLKLENQLCFPLYACARKIVNSYNPYLKPLGLTYTQYIVFMVLWEKENIRVGQLGQILSLDTG